MATRTAKGIVKDKASGTTLTLADASVIATHCIIVKVGFKGTVVPTVAAGNRTLNKVIHRVNSTEEFGAAIYYARSLKISNTRDIVATWGTATTARVMEVITLDRPHLFFEAAGNIQNTASPTTSINLLDLPVHDCFHAGCFVSEGPSNDAVLTFSSDWTAGQRDGTVGIPPISNITLAEGYKVGRCIDAEEMDASGSDTRDFCNCLASFTPYPNAPAADSDGTLMEVGDTVKYGHDGNTSTVTSLAYVIGYPFVKVTLANGLVYAAHMLEEVD